MTSNTYDQKQNQQVGQHGQNQRLQEIIDRAAIFNLYVNRGGSQVLRFSIDTRVFGSARVLASNEIGEQVGSLHCHWKAISRDTYALPDGDNRYVTINRRRSQRIVLADASLEFADGKCGLKVFGTGRTFPMQVDGKCYLTVSVIAEITGGHGALSNAEGNLVLTGTLDEHNQFEGHVIVRLIDESESYLVDQLPTQRESSTKSACDMTFLNFVGQKGTDSSQTNRFSMNSDGNPRGLNISTILKRSKVDFRFDLQGRLKVVPIATFEATGQEIGFGPLPDPRNQSSGTPMQPITFEGVAQYGFSKTGTLTTNIIEGRRVNKVFRDVPERLGFRFGFFGPIQAGYGNFENTQGIFYGASASFLTPPPENEHIVTHFYAAMLIDPAGRHQC